MIEVTVDKLLKAYTKHNYKVWTGINSSGVFKGLDLNIFGIRSNNLNQSQDAFDDLVGVFYKTESDYFLKTWVATTDPGKYFLQNPMNVNGTFILIPGQYLGAYKLGIHHTHEALVQVGNLKGYRDTNKDVILDLDPGQIYNGTNFGVNIHHKENDSENIGLGSAGCQVFKHTNEHIEFISICKQASKIWGNSFSYTLFTENDIF